MCGRSRRCRAHGAVVVFVAVCAVVAAFEALAELCGAVAPFLILSAMARPQQS